MKDAVHAAPQQQTVVELMEAELRVSDLFPPHCHAVAATLGHACHVCGLNIRLETKLSVRTRLMNNNGYCLLLIWNWMFSSI